VSYVVGLTGGIGSGKSAVARAFAALGADLADADEAAHAVSAPGEAGHAAIVATFGPEVVAPDGTLDRARLRRRVFDDPQARARLEALLHPLIRDRLQRDMKAWKGPYGLLVAPLLLERGSLLAQVSRVLVVDCPEDEQVRRVGLRSGLSPSETRTIMATQMPRRERRARADDVIDNGGEPAAIGPQVGRLDALYRTLATQAAAAHRQDA
jgi:dephospho-CoA kinase